MRRASIFSVTLTRRGWSLVGAALGLVVGSFLLGTIEMLILGVSAIALLAARVVVARGEARPRPRGATAREARSAPRGLGRPDRPLGREPGATTPSPLLVATDWFDEGRRAARFLVPPLAAGATARAAYRVPTRRRGRYRVGPLSLSATDPFGLARRVLPSVADSDVLVRPRVDDIVAPVAVGSRVAGESDLPAPRAMVSDLGDEFLTLREYELGDDLRRVHWRSTARTGDLMIRQNEARWRSRAAVVLDVHPDGHDPESFEVAVGAVASIVTRLVRLQRRVEVATSAGEFLGTGGDPRHDVIDRLATVGPHSTDRLAIVLENLATHRRADLVIAVLGRVGPDVIRALGSLAGIDVVAVLTQPVALTSTSSVVVVDASSTPFASAWNQVFTPLFPYPVEEPRMATRARVVAPFALAALSAAAGLSLGRVFDSGRFVLPVLGAAVLPHAIGALARAAPVVDADRSRAGGDCAGRVRRLGTRRIDDNVRDSRPLRRSTRSTTNCAVAGICCAPLRHRRR